MHITQITQSLHDIESIVYRVEQLSKPEYRYYEHFYEAIENTSYLEQEYENVTTPHGLTQSKPLGTYILTDLGRKALQDYEMALKTHRREMWLKNAWIPILVTVATNLAIRALEWLLPLVQRWISSIS